MVADIDFVVVVVRYEMLIGFMLPVYECMLLVGWLVTSVYLDGLLAGWLAGVMVSALIVIKLPLSFSGQPVQFVRRRRRNRKRINNPSFETIYVLDPFK